MAESLRIFHNPRCSKSRKARQLLEEQGVSVEVVEYLKTPPDVAELDRILRMLDCEPRELMRRGEARYKELGLDATDLDRDSLVRIMVDNPVLIERPIVVKGGRAVLGRPPEKALELV